MQQIAIYNKGERDYKLIEGGTGPLVYPGAHVLIYRVLHWLTDEGADVQRAQYVFALVYLLTLAVVLQCYRNAKVRFSKEAPGLLVSIDVNRGEIGGQVMREK